jgi:hypothetical protein
MGLGTVILAAVAYAKPSIRNIEEELPDMIPDQPIGEARLRAEPTPATSGEA